MCIRDRHERGQIAPEPKFIRITDTAHIIEKLSKDIRHVRKGYDTINSRGVCRVGAHVPQVTSTVVIRSENKSVLAR